MTISTKKENGEKPKKNELTESIKVSPQVKEKLESIKVKEGHTSYDSVIRMLLIIRAVFRKFHPRNIWDIDKDENEKKED